MKISLIEWASIFVIGLCVLQSTAHVYGRLEADQARLLRIPNGLCSSAQVLTGFDSDERAICKPRLSR